MRTWRMPPRGASNEKHDEPEDSLAAHWGSFLRAARCSCRWPLASACSLCRWVTAPGPTREALVARLLRQTSDQGIAVLDGVAHLPADDQVVRAMDVLTRLSATDDAAAMATARMLAAHHSELVRRAEGQARGAPGRPGHYDLANAILRPLAQQLGARVREVLARDEPANTTYQRDLAISCRRLGDLARQSGQADEAGRLYRQSLNTNTTGRWRVDLPARPASTTCSPVSTWV